AATPRDDPSAPRHDRWALRLVGATTRRCYAATPRDDPSAPRHHPSAPRHDPLGATTVGATTRPCYDQCTLQRILAVAGVGIRPAVDPRPVRALVPRIVEGALHAGVLRHIAAERARVAGGRDRRRRGRAGRAEVGERLLRVGE